MNMNGKFLAGGGKMGELIRTYDWAKSPIGMPGQWPQSLRTTISIVLNSKFPMFLFWGKELTCFYNDAFRPSLGNNGKHPHILGKPGAEVWPEIWPIIKPLIDQVLAGGEATWSEDQLIPIYRNGKIEDAYWTFSYSAIYDETEAAAGVFVTCTETTHKINTTKALLESKDQLQFAIDATELGTFEYNPITKRYFANQRLKEWFGVPTENEFDLDVATNSIIDQDRKKVKEAIKNTFDISSGGRYDVEYTIRHPITKKEKIVRAKGKATFNSDHIANRFSGTLQDVTEQVMAHRKVEESENRFRTLSNAPDVLIAEGNEESSAIYFSNGWADITGRTIQELLDYGWLHLVHEEDKVAYLNVYLSAFEKKEPFQGEFRLLVKSGNYRWMLSQGSPRFLPNGSFAGYISSTVDITLLKETEIALKISSEKEIAAREKIAESEERFRTMAEGTDILIAVGNETSNAVYFNKAWSDLTGRATEDLLNFGWADLIHPADKQHYIDTYLDAFEKQKPFTGEFRLLNKEGNYTWLLAKGPPRFRSNGAFAGYISSCIDITERKKAEETLRQSAEKQLLARIKVEESEQRVRTMVENAPFPIGVYVGKEMRIELANQATIEAWGKGNDVIGKLYSEILPEFNNQNIYKQLDQVFRSGIPFHTKNHRLDILTNGLLRTFYFNYSFTPLFDSLGKVYAVMSTAADVTDLNIAKKKVEEVAEELARTTNRLHLALEAGKLGSYELNLQSTIIECTPQFAQNFGISASKQFKYPDLIKSIVPEDRKVMENAIRTALAKNEAYNTEFRVSWPDESLHWLHAVGIPYYNEEGKAVEIIGVSTEITEQKLFEEELGKQVRERTKELGQKNKDLEKMNNELESFAYVSSHDLQEPLRKIQTFADRILVKEQKNLSEDGKNYFNRMQLAAKRMQTLIEDLLAYSRTNNNTDQIFKTTDLTAIANEVKEELQETIQAKQATVTIGNLCEARVIPFQFQQLFHNLISNSLKFSSSKRNPTIEIKSETIKDPELPAHKLFDTTYCHITFSDNGIGFEPAYHQRIFEVFQRLHGKDDYKGTGIGLSIVKKIVDNHNGIITATGEVDKGATFDIYIPLA